MSVTLRPTTRDDVPFVIAVEQAPHARDFVLAWPAEQHGAAIADPDQGT